MRKRLSYFVVFAGLSLGLHASAQKPAANKFRHAIERSQDAARIISLLALSESGLPKELVVRAKAIGVFPEVRKETLGWSTDTMGYGVISTRLKEGWSTSAFYEFAGGGFGNPFAKNEKMALILLFLTDNAITAFEKGRVELKNEKRAEPGPVGELTESQRTSLADAKIVAYAYYNGKLTGVGFNRSFGKSFVVNPENKVNTPLYGMKGREVLAGKKVDAASLPAGIPAYQQALEKYYPQP